MGDGFRMKMVADFEKVRPIVEAWRSDVAGRWERNGEVLFELAFCLSTPQSKAARCREAITMLRDEGLLASGSAEEIAAVLRTRSRFHNTKGKRIADARDRFDEIYAQIQSGHDDPVSLRNALYLGIKGMGTKEASHFLRNIDLGDDLAILDVHIIREMVDQGLAEEKDTAAGIPPRRYAEFESKFRQLADAVGMSMLELDCTIWLTRSGSSEIM